MLSVIAKIIGHSTAEGGHHVVQHRITGRAVSEGSLQEEHDQAREEGDGDPVVDGLQNSLLSARRIRLYHRL